MHIEERPDTPRLLTEEEVAQRLRLSKRTLQAWRAQGCGPVFHQLGRAIRYDIDDVRAWLGANLSAAREVM